jgi:hypothetical protein
LIADSNVMLHCGIYNRHAATWLKDFIFGIVWADYGARVAIWQ